MPKRNGLDRNRSGSISVGRSRRRRRTSHVANSPMATAPSTSRAATYSPPSCHTRIPSTIPPMPTTDRVAPTQSTTRGPV